MNNNNHTVTVPSPPVYDLAFFRSFFAAIPDDRWTTGVLFNGAGQRCALGHTYSGNFDDAREFVGGWTNPKTTALADLFTPLHLPLLDHFGFFMGCMVPAQIVAKINNGVDPRYQQSSPKARILAAIDDLLAIAAAEERAAEAREILRLEALETRPLVALDSGVWADAR